MDNANLGGIETIRWVKNPLLQQGVQALHTSPWSCLGIVLWGRFTGLSVMVRIVLS